VVVWKSCPRVWLEDISIEEDDLERTKRSSQLDRLEEKKEGRRGSEVRK
jgi:hypothetical protein